MPIAEWQGHVNVGSARGNAWRNPLVLRVSCDAQRAPGRTTPARKRGLRGRCLALPRLTWPWWTRKGNH